MIIKADDYYLKNLTEIMCNGTSDENPRPRYKDGIHAHTTFITQVFEKYDIAKGEFPITTLRNTAVKTGIREILWIFQKQTSDLQVARNLGINWWEEWNIGDGTIGQRYGATINRYDLMNKLLVGLQRDPFGRRHIMNMFQEEDLKSPGLHPCAYETLWSVRRQADYLYLDMTLIQRSNDYIMAGYINKIQYVALMMMVAGHLGYKVGTFSHLTQNLHIYDRHMDAADEILTRNPLGHQPTLELKGRKDFYDYTIDDFMVKGVKDIPKLTHKLEIAI